MRKIALDISPATETHCGDGKDRCQLWDPGYVTCSVFWREPVSEPDYDYEAHEYKRLPACRAAEVKP